MMEKSKDAAKKGEGQGTCICARPLSQNFHVIEISASFISHIVFAVQLHAITVPDLAS